MEIGVLYSRASLRGELAIDWLDSSGRYEGTIRMDKDAGWRIELKNVPHRSNIQIYIGNRIVDSLGCILVGKQISKDLCTLENSTEGFTDLKLAMASAAAPSADTDPEVPIQVTILDYFDGAKFLDSNLSARGLLSQEVIETSPPTRSDLDTLWTVSHCCPAIS